MISKAIALAVSICLAASLAEAQESRHPHSGSGQPWNAAAGTSSVDHMTTASTIGDLLAHPGFEGFARLLLPWDDRPTDPSMPLGEVGSLLPYHSNVRPDEIVSSLNRMIDDIGAGHQVFHDFYTEAQKRQELARDNTGLFFFRGRLGAPFAVIAPGGGFAYVGSLHEGFPYATALSRLGYNAFVLKYRAGEGGAVATEDLAFALSYIFENARNLQVDVEGYSLWGSSAGARMVASIGSHGTAGFIGRELSKPSTVVMAYTSHSDRSENEPPTFAVVGERDGISPPAAMERRIEALRTNGTAVQFRVFPDVGHGFGLGTKTSAECWLDEAVAFWEKSQ